LPDTSPLLAAQLTRSSILALANATPTSLKDKLAVKSWCASTASKAPARSPRPIMRRWLLPGAQGRLHLREFKGLPSRFKALTAKQAAAYRAAIPANADGELAALAGALRHRPRLAASRWQDALYRLPRRLARQDG
jgi:hypothetical protein